MSSRASSYSSLVRESSMPSDSSTGTGGGVRKQSSAIEKSKRRSYSNGSVRGFTSRLFKGKQQQKPKFPDRSRSLSSGSSSPKICVDKSVRDQRGEGVELMSEYNSPLILLLIES